VLSNLGRRAPEKNKVLFVFGGGVTEKIKKKWSSGFRIFYERKGKISGKSFFWGLESLPPTKERESAGTKDLF